MGEGGGIFKENATAREGEPPGEPLGHEIRLARTLALPRKTMSADGEGIGDYCRDVRGCRVLDSAKKVSMTLRAAGRSVQRFTRVDR